MLAPGSILFTLYSIRGSAMLVDFSLPSNYIEGRRITFLTGLKRLGPIIDSCVLLEALKARATVVTCHYVQQATRGLSALTSAAKRYPG